MKSQTNGAGLKGTGNDTYHVLNPYGSSHHVKPNIALITHTRVAVG